MDKLVILAETGSDITKEVAEAYGIELVPMHVSFGSETKDDGTFLFRRKRFTDIMSERERCQKPAAVCRRILQRYSGRYERNIRKAGFCILPIRRLPPALIRAPKLQSIRDM